MSYNKILQDIRKKKLAPIYCFHGPESYFIDRLTEAVEVHGLEEHERSFNQDIVYGKDVDFKTLYAYLMQYPAMAERRLVILKEAADFRGFGELKRYFEKPNPTTVFVIAHKHKKFGKGLAAITRSGVAFESKKIYENKIPAWIMSYLDEQQRKINPDTARLLGEYLGNDLTKIVNELTKIHVNIPADQTIDHDIVEKYIGISKEYNVFELQDALGAKDFAKAMRIAHYFAGNERKYPMVMTISSLYGYFSKVYLTHIHRSKNDADLAKELGLRFQFFAKKYRQAAFSYPMSEVIRVISLLKEYDLKSKGVNNDTMTITSGPLLKELILKIFAKIPAHAN